MPVDSTFDNALICNPETEIHYYDTYIDGTHAPTCRCGKVVVTIDNTNQNILKRSER